MDAPIESPSDLELVAITGGDFSVGSDPEEVEQYLASFGYAYGEFGLAEVHSWYAKQIPKHPCSVSDFQLGRFPVTNRQYAEFELNVFGGPVRSDRDRPTCPVEGVSYFQARAYCQWLGQRLDLDLRLPTEQEWEFAASSGGESLFPWGNEFTPQRANTAEGGIGASTPVDFYPGGSSAHGVFDLAGNVEEWTDSVYLPYAGASYVHDHISIDCGDFYPVLRGGSYRHHGDLCLSSRRHGFRPNYSITGFRVALSDKG